MPGDLNIERKDAVYLVLPTRASGLGPCQYSSINRKVFIGLGGLFERGCWVQFIHAFGDPVLLPETATSRFRGGHLAREGQVGEGVSPIS